MPNAPIQLIVSADDYGYFPCVSRGILKAASVGSVTATGIFANGQDLEEQVAWLADYGNLDLGAHLNLTSRIPLTSAIRNKLEARGGSFPNAFAMAGLILSGRISSDMVRAEWCSQIETIMRLGVNLRFLNSHEHIHMLPKLFDLTLGLAEEYRIPHVRLTRAEWLAPFAPASVLRNFLLQAMESVNRLKTGPGVPFFLGLSRSGKLDLAYLKMRFATLKPGNTYELMCHPGYFEQEEITEPRLLAYHAWEDELEVLTSQQIKGLFDEFNIKTIRYRELGDACPSS